MKKTTLIFVLGAALLSACTKNLPSLNTDPINPSTVPSYTLFTNAERLTSNIVITPDINDNTFRLFEQQWTETQYLNESQYDITDRPIPDDIWAGIYAGSLINFEKAKSFAATDVSDPATRKNDIAIIDILEVYNFYYLVTTFGNIPYSDAFNVSHPFPVFDDAATVYSSLLTRLNTDISAISTSAGSWGAADQIYGGDPAKWLKFANTFKIKMGITISKSDPATAKATVESAFKDPGGIFASDADDALFTYYGSPPSTNPTWVQLIQSGRHDFVGTQFFMGLLGVPAAGTATPTDPRTPYYFAETTGSGNIYLGSPNATVVTAADYSLPSGPQYTPGSVGDMTNQNYPGDLLDYSELEFNLAEASARGYDVSLGGTTAAYYANAIASSISFWTGVPTTDSSIATYLAANPIDPVNPLQSIAQQEYLALYNRGWDAWTLTRRLGYPDFNATALVPPGAYSAFPVRLTYPVVEQNTNPINEGAAAKAIGGDDVTTALWFFK